MPFEMDADVKKIYDIMREKQGNATDPYFKGLWEYACNRIDMAAWPTAIEAWMRQKGLPDYGEALKAPEIQLGVAPLVDEYILWWRNNTESFRLPVNPTTDPQFSVGHNNHNFDTASLGTFKAIGRKGLTSVTIESFFPDKHMPYVVVPKSDLKRPLEYIKMLEKWKNSNEPIRLIITGYINMAFAIERLDWHREIGTKDIVFSLELEEYPFSNVSEVDYKEPVVEETGLKERPDDGKSDKGKEEADKGEEKVVVVKSQADTLWHIAQVEYGDGLLWKEIAKVNKIKDPRSLQLGQKITVPPRKQVKPS